MTTVPRISLRPGSNLITGVVLICFGVILGIYLSLVHDSSKNPDYFVKDESENLYYFRISEDPEEKEKSIKCIVEVWQRNDSLTSGTALIYFQKSERSLALRYGDCIQMKGRFKEVTANGNPKEFDYSRYLRIHNIRHQAYLTDENWLKSKKDPNAIYATVLNSRRYLSNVLNSSKMEESNRKVANALILGKKESLDKDLLRSYSSAGAMHVLAVSGLHVGIIMLILAAAFKPIKRFKYGVRLYVLLMLLGVWLYALITGMSPSVLRASIMFSFIIVGQELNRDTSVYQSIIVSAFVLILLDPFVIFKVGFQLSYLAVLGIVYLQPKIQNLLFVKNKWLFKVWQITTVSLAAQMATFPLGLYYFHQFPNFFLLSNLIVIPLAFLILIVGIAFLIFHLVPWISDILLYLLDLLISFLNNGVEWVQSLPNSILWGISIEWYEVFLIYAILIFGVSTWVQRKTSHLFYSMGLFLLFTVLNVIEDESLEGQNQVCVYNIKGEAAIDIFYGRSNLFISSHDLLQNEEQLLFHVKHNWFFRTGQESPNEWQNIDELNVMSLGQNTFSILTEENHEWMLNHDVNPDIVLFHDLSFIDQKLLDRYARNDTQVILASSIGFRLKRFVKSRENLKVYDVSENGAFELNF